MAGGLELDEERWAVVGVVEVDGGDEDEGPFAGAPGVGEIVGGEQAGIAVEHGAGLGAQGETGRGGGDEQGGEEEEGAAHVVV